MRNKKTKLHTNHSMGFKGELVDGKDELDKEPTGRFMNNNPYKTPPNNLTTKDKK